MNVFAVMCVGVMGTSRAEQEQGQLQGGWGSEPMENAEGQVGKLRGGQLQTS